jgi:plastocyanin
MLALGLAAFAAVSPAGSADGAGPHIAIEDDCDPNDPAWNPTGGCIQKGGDVSFLEFVGEISPPLSLLSTAVLGHQAWRNDPSYLKVKAGTKVRVKNEGGRIHTFTEVARFGGGKAGNPALNAGLTQAPECPGSVDLAAGEIAILDGLAVGNHRFMCCIHPWMRAMIKVQDRN